MIIIARGDSMQELSLSYCVHIDNYFDPQIPYYEFEDGFYDDREINAQTDYEEVLSLVNELRVVIKKDFLNILETRIKCLNNNEGLIKEFHRLIDTIDNGIDIDVCSGQNFFFLTDNYLCFNNFENYVDELMLGELGSDAKTYETIVIVDVHLKSFYFVRMTRRILAEAESATINAFLVKDNNVKKRKVNFKSPVELVDYTDSGIKKILALLPIRY